MKSKLLPIVGIALIVILLIYTLSFSDYQTEYDEDLEENSREAFRSFENILTAKVQPSDSGNIFFVETGDSLYDVKLNARQCCAIESAAFRNPDKRIFVLFVSRNRLNKLELTSLVNATLSHSNVQFNYLDLEELSKGTPMEDFITSRKLSQSSYRGEHKSDVVRLLLLWKYGGTYLDTDMIVMKKFDTNLVNFACPESKEFMNGAALNLNSHEISNLSDLFVNDLTKNFDGKLYSQNGPLLITRVVRNLCNIKNLTEIVPPQNCQGFNVLREGDCYPVEFNHWPDLMNEQNAHLVMKKVEDSFVVHFWNKFSKKKSLRVESNAPYIQLARKSCPKVIEKCEKYF
jgi:lactosylceramide 4-alpha-galactosyltransferase